MRRGWTCIAAGALAALLSVGSFAVDATRAGADELLGYDLSADARGLQLFVVIADQPFQPELNIPQASSTQQSGTGYGLASAAWPGAIVANGGSLLGILVPGFPPEVAALLIYPVRAEARTGQDPPVTSYDLPGLTMRSRADNSSAESEAGAQGLSVLPGTFGVARATSSTRVVNELATSTARSVVQNLNIAGVLQIDQIVSTATAKSDGTTGSGTATTKITGATVMGQGVTIDETGLHFGTTNQPIDAIIQQVAKQALAAAGISVTVGPTTKEINGPAAVVGANSLVITLTQNGYTLGYALGGARAASVASAGGGDDNEVTTDLGGDLLGGGDVLGGGDSFGDDLGALGDAGSGSVDGASASPGAPVEIVPAVATANGKGLPIATVVLGVLAALLLAVGMRRLNTAVLADPTAGIACTLPGEDA
ncbi:MAG: hypothetical protein H0U92_00060 [Actinobacteria bacterium]|nr:hypothetical protein [Actinomycetota bacterium]